MEENELQKRTYDDDGMLRDVEFYKYIFKKTEKIVCAVFYILHTDAELSRFDRDVVQDVSETARILLNMSIQSLKAKRTHVETQARDIQIALIALESKLRVAHASKMLREGYLEVFLHEFDSVQRALRKYTETKTKNPLFEYGSVSEVSKVHKRKHERILQTSSNDTEREIEIRSRRERITEVIKDKGNATIKDIALEITDCSEKTIQRELISMIKDNLIVREGERRWSKYSIVV